MSNVLLAAVKRLPKTPLAPRPSRTGQVQADRRAVLILKARDVILRFDCLCLITANFHEFAGLVLSTPSLVEKSIHTWRLFTNRSPPPIFCLTRIVSGNTVIFMWKFLKQFKFGFVGPLLLNSLTGYEQGWSGSRLNNIIYLLLSLPLECLDC